MILALTLKSGVALITDSESARSLLTSKSTTPESTKSERRRLVVELGSVSNQAYKEERAYSNSSPVAYSGQHHTNGYRERAREREEAREGEGECVREGR